MKKCLVIVSFILGICIMAAPMVMALPYQVTSGSSWGPWQSGSGGEFTLTASGGLEEIVGSSFQTFCVQTGEYIYLNSTYEAVISDRTSFGGIQLTQGAAYLYSEFINGTLNGYDFTNSVSRNNSASALQAALWYFMGTGSNPGNSFVDLGNSHGGFALDNGSYGVAILNLWVPGHVGEQDYERQDMLASVPEPAGLLLLGIGIVGVASLRRKFRK